MKKKELKSQLAIQKREYIDLSANQVEEPALPRETYWGQAVQHLIHHRMALTGGIILIIILFGCSLGPLVYKVSPTHIDFTRSYMPPSIGHPFGTNDLGQDMMARVMRGGRISLIVGLFSMVVAIALGTMIGAISGFYAGTIDNVLMRITDFLLSIPQLPILLVVVYLFREFFTGIAGPLNGILLLVVILIGALNWMTVARLVRAGYLSTREKEFVRAARAMGASNNRIILRHILPSVVSQIIVAATLAVGTAIITESTLSFLGLGFPPDTPTWGRLVYDAQHNIEFAPWVPFFPGMAVFLTVLSINLLGDGLRDALDPRQRYR